MKIGDEVMIRGNIDEIRKDVIIISNDGGYFGTIPEEIITDAVKVVRCKNCRNCSEKGTYDCPSGYGYLYCSIRKSVVDEEDYCSWGEEI